MFRSLLIAAVVTGLGLAGAVSTASAASDKGGSNTSAKIASAKVLGFRGSRAGGCGEFMYWKGGKCMDARDKTPEEKK